VYPGKRVDMDTGEFVVVETEAAARSFRGGWPSHGAVPGEQAALVASPFLAHGITVSAFQVW
jgi:hypothetical protein